LGGVAIPRAEKFRYLGSIIEEKGDINDRIKEGWQKWRSASGTLCDKKIFVRLKGKVYRIIVRPALLYRAECWLTKKTQVQRKMVVEIRMIHWMCGHIRLDRIRNEVIREKV